jgi:hypothetical protein
MRWGRPNQRDRRWDLRNEGLKERFHAFLSEYARSHEDWSPEQIASAFLAANPQMVAEYVNAFAADLVRQRDLWPGTSQSVSQ